MRNTLFIAAILTLSPLAMAQSGEANTYGADGQRSSGSGRRTLGSA